MTDVIPEIFPAVLINHDGHLHRITLELTRVNRTVDEDAAARRSLKIIFGNVEGYCKRFGMNGSWNRVVRLQRDIVGNASSAELASGVVTLREVIEDDLKSKYFLYVPNERAGFYRHPREGWDVAITKYAKLTTDIEEAGRGLAINRPTACVFHLMRIMETGLQRLGKKLRVSIDPQNETWYQITKHVDKVIEAYPTKTSAQKKKKEKLSATSAHLNAIRIAWRNKVMHPKAEYSQEEAIEIFIHARAFMNDIVGLI